MRSESLIHDASFATTTAIMQIIGPCIRDDERADCFQEIYQACKAGIEAYSVHEIRMEHRMRPSNN